MSSYFGYLGETTKFTLELRDIVTGENPVNIWDFDYPSYYQGEAKQAFEKKVIDHFYFRQIGVETVGRWLHLFRARMREIMPYYLQMYKSVEIMEKVDDPFGNVDITETFEQTATGNRSGETTARSTETATNNATVTPNITETLDKEHRFMNTPQSSIANLDSYLTEAAKDTDTQKRTGTETTAANGETESTANGTTSENSTDTIKHTLTRKGNQGVNTYAHDMIEFRQSFIDVDMMIINNLQDLFLMVY